MHISALVKPESIAVLGASNRPGLGRWIIESSRTLGFEGPVWPVNPKYEEVEGLRCYPSLADLPAPPDVVAFCLGREHVLTNIELLARSGGRAAVIYDSGFAELGGDGLQLQRRIEAICKEAGIALCGPNCMGVLNPVARSTTFKQTVRHAEGLAGNVGLVAQSGSICATLLADLRRFGFSAVISSGNEAVVSLSDYISHLATDPATRVIATFIEAVRDPEGFVAALDLAWRNNKPVVVLKVGRSERTQRAIQGHTGGLAGESRVFSEVLRAHKAIEVRDLDEMTELLALCQGERWPKGRGLNVMTTSGGQAELLLDLSVAEGVELEPLPGSTKARIEREVGPITGDGNPLDAWGNGDAKTNLPRALAALADTAGNDTIAFCSSDSTDGQPLGRTGRELEYAEILATAARHSAKPHIMLTMRPGVMHAGQAKLLRSAGVAIVCGARQALVAIDRLAAWSAAQPPVLASRITRPAEISPGRPTINEHDAKQLFAAAGLPVVRERLVETAGDAVAAARAFGYPVVLKAVSDHIPHKSEHGLVKVALASDDAVRAAMGAMQATVERLGKPLAGYLVQEMVSDGIEVFAGVSRDPDFGLTLAFGMGGIAIEVMEDFALRQLPLRQGDAEAMIREVRGAALLDAYRGRSAADVEAIAGCLYALADFAVVNARHIAEIDLNPIKVRAAGQGCVIVDALIATR